MKYYTDINNNLYANPSNLDGLVEVESAVREDGTLLPKHKNLSGLDTYEDGTYATYYNQDGTIDTVKEAKLAKATTLSDINLWYEGEVAKLTKGIPNTERDTWTKQETEARAYQADATAIVPFITNLSTTRGVPLDYLVTKIIEKANAYAIAVGTLTGERQRREDELAVS